MLGKLSYIISAETQPLHNNLNEAKTAMKSADQQMNKSGKAIADSSKKMGTEAGNAIAPMEQGLNAINPAAGQAVAGMKSMSMGARALNAALGPIGLIIGAIGLAVAALTAYFRGSVEGQQKMAKIMAYLGGVATTIKDAFIDLGKWIVWAFENPQAAVKELWEIIKTNLINRFQGLVDMYVAGWKVISQGAKGVGLAIKGIFDAEARERSKAAFAEMQQGMVDFGKAAIMAATGVEDLIGKVTDGAKEISRRANETAALQERENALTMEQIANKTKIARLDAEIAAARLIGNDETRTAVEQLAGMERAEELVNQKFAIREKMAREALAIQQERMAISHNIVEDEQKLAELATELINLEAQRDSEARNLLRRKTAIANRVQSDHDAEMKAIQDEKIARQEAFDAEMEERKKILDDIHVAGLTEVAVLQETMNQKLALFKWSEEERLKIAEYYQGQIDAVIDSEAAARQAVLDEIRRAGMTEVEMLQEALSQKLALYEWSEEERLLITEYYQGQMNELAKETGELWEHLGKLMGGAIGGALNQIGASLAGASKDFRGFVSSMLDGIQQIINMLLAEAIARMIAKESSKGIVGLATAAVGVGVLKALFAKNVPKMASGGVIPPGYPNDTYPALLSSGETVTPPGKLHTSGQLTARVSGGDLLFVLTDAQQSYEITF